MLSGEDDLNDVYKEIVAIKTLYYQVGICLGLPAGELETIWSNYHQLTDRAFVQVLLWWLRQHYNVERFGPPTWRRLVEAVDSPAGGNQPALAKAIANKHPVFGMCCIMNLKHKLNGY